MLQRRCYHLTAKSSYRYAPGKLWPRFIKAMDQSRPSAIDINAYVLMSNHYHVLIRAGHEDMLEFASQLRGHLSFVFDHKYSWRWVGNRVYFANSYKYLYQNPVRAGMVRRCEHYPYSSLKTDIAVVHPFGVNDEFKLFWINQPTQLSK